MSITNSANKINPAFYKKRTIIPFLIEKWRLQKFFWLYQVVLRIESCNPVIRDVLILEKQKREEEVKAAKAKAEEKKKPPKEPDTATEAEEDALLSSEDTDDGNRLELSSLTTSDAASERLQELEEPVETQKILRKKEPVVPRNVI